MAGWDGSFGAMLRWLDHDGRPTAAAARFHGLGSRELSLNVGRNSKILSGVPAVTNLDDEAAISPGIADAMPRQESPRIGGVERLVYVPKAEQLCRLPLITALLTDEIVQ